MKATDRLPTLHLDAPAPVRRRLDQVVRRVRSLHLLAGASRLVTLVVASLVLLYAVDRLLELPRGVRGLALLGTAVFLGRETWRRLLRPAFFGLQPLDAARLVEGSLPVFEGRLVSALQLPRGEPGSLERAVADQAAAACEGTDLRVVLTARPSLRETLRAGGSAAALVLLVLVTQPDTDVFVQRLLLRDVPWPRDTHLALVVPERSPVHVVRPDGSIVVSRGGVLNVTADWSGRRPERTELVVAGADGERSALMALGSGGGFHGHATAQPGDRSILVRGGDDDGEETRLVLEVIEPPRLDDPLFELAPPAYLGEPARTVGPEGLVVPEGTAITVRGRPRGDADSATLQLASVAEPLPLVLTADEQGALLSGTFVAEESDTLAIVLTGAWGLATPDPSQHALLVHKDRPPALRVYAPARSDVKVTAKALVPFAVVAEDDHGVRSVTLQPRAEGNTPIPFTADGSNPRQHRHVLDLAALDLAALGLSSTIAYAIEAVDGRELPGRGPQAARADGRRIDIVDDSEVQRVLADRQLRLKENVVGIRDRQQRATQTVVDLLALEAAIDESELVAAAVAQNQVSTRLLRETRELCSILEETITNRLDPGPGAEAVLARHLEAWSSQPVEETFQAGAWRELAREYEGGRFGRLDLVGRLLEMSALALDLSSELSPAAHEALVAARVRPDAATLGAAQDAQRQVEATLQRLLERMDEWEDYQEVLTLVKLLIDDQKSLQVRTLEALNKEGGQ